MLSVTQAREEILSRARALATVTMRIDADALDLVIAHDVTSDLDMPPFDKSQMDGYAIRLDDLAQRSADLTVIEEVTAGQVPRKTVNAGEATRIMTGAPLPAGANAVVMVERTRMLDGGRVQLEDADLRVEQNIVRQGTEVKRGDVVILEGSRLRPQEIGVLAMVGARHARVIPRPRVALLPTGDEIVNVEVTPGPGQIRNSNGMMLLAQIARTGAVPAYLGIAPDRREDLRALVQRGLEADVLVLSGGVSAGKLDLVPGVLTEAGATTIFHKVEMKPGKPMLFAVLGEKLIFGLPGNPLSALVCFELFVRPAIEKLSGREPGPRLVKAVLAEDHASRTDRPTYHPARLAVRDGVLFVTALHWKGSADLRGVLEANAFVIFPPGDHMHRKGDGFEVLVPDEFG